MKKKIIPVIVSIIIGWIIYNLIIFSIIYFENGSIDFSNKENYVNFFGFSVSALFMILLINKFRK
jgi:hypothetical protein